MLTAVVLLSACTGGPVKVPVGAPELRVVTGLYPLAEAARVIGGKKATVVDLVPDGQNPLTYKPAAIGQPGLLIDIGGGFQPGLESVAAGAPGVLALGGALHATDPYVWLDPTTMGNAVTVIARAMESADPSASPLFRQNAQSLQAEVSSEGEDYSSTLSTCRISTMVTSDNAFTVMASDYGLDDRVAGGDPGSPKVGEAASVVEQRSLGTVFSEPWVNNAGVQAVGRMAGARVKVLDTLAGAPLGGYPKGLDYFTLMEEDLSTISSALGCSFNEQ